MEIPMLKIRRSWDRLIFNMRIPILVIDDIFILGGGGGGGGGDRYSPWADSGMVDGWWLVTTQTPVVQSRTKERLTRSDRWNKKRKKNETDY